MNNVIYIITGAAGHLGGTIIQTLTNTDCLVRGLILPGEEGTKGDNVEYFTGDVTKPETLDKLFENTNDAKVIVIHCAGLISIQNKVSAHVYNVNVLGTKNIIEKCKQYGVHRLVYVSSVHALPEKKGAIIREVYKFSPNTVEGSYAKTKAEATQAVLDAANNGLDAVVVHPSGIVGPLDRYGGNHMVQMMRMYLENRLSAAIKGGYDFVDVRDVSDGILRAAERGQSGECYILSNRYVTMEEMFEEMRKFTGRKRKIKLMPRWVAKIFIPISTWSAKIKHKRPILTSYAVQTLAVHTRFCHDKATIELGYQPRSFKDTVKDTLKYLQHHSDEQHL